MQPASAASASWQGRKIPCGPSAAGILKRSLRDPARRLGVAPKTIASGRKRSSGADQPAGPQAVRPDTLSPDQGAIIVAFRRHTLKPLRDCLHTVQATLVD
jgi:hypothetical protein